MTPFPWAGGPRRPRAWSVGPWLIPTARPPPLAWPRADSQNPQRASCSAAAWASGYGAGGSGYTPPTRRRGCEAASRASSCPSPRAPRCLPSGGRQPWVARWGPPRTRKSGWRHSGSSSSRASTPATTTCRQILVPRRTCSSLVQKFSRHLSFSLPLLNERKENQAPLLFLSMRPRKKNGLGLSLSLASANLTSVLGQPSTPPLGSKP